jgi:hypothetical protein
VAVECNNESVPAGLVGKSLVGKSRELRTNVSKPFGDRLQDFLCLGAVFDELKKIGCSKRFTGAIGCRHEETPLWFISEQRFQEDGALRGRPEMRNTIRRICVEFYVNRSQELVDVGRRILE